MQEVVVLRETISDDPIGHVYYLLDDNDEVIESLEIDESGLPAQITRTANPQEPRTPASTARTRKLMDREAEQWALDEARRRGEELGHAREQLRALRVKYVVASPVEESSQ